MIENGIDRPKLDRARAIDRSVHRQRWGWSQPVILSVANLVPRKGLDRLLAADAILRDRGRSFLHVIIGRGSEARALRGMARALGLEDRVQFIEQALDDASLASAIAACDVFALASRTFIQPPAMEGFGIVYAEAAYLGRPVVGGRSGGVPSVIRDGRTGVLVDPEGNGAPLRFADALERILVDRSWSEALAARARRDAMERFDWKRNARRILERTAPSYLALPLRPLAEL